VSEATEPVRSAHPRSSVPILRSASPHDLDDVAMIFAYYVVNTVATFEEEPPTLEYWRERLDTLTALGLPFLVIESQGRIAGFAYAAQWRPMPAYRYTVADTIYVAPGLTGLGLGRTLLNGLLERCTAAGMRQVVAVIADPTNSSSPALHRASGFTEVGTFKKVGFKHGRELDTLLLQRSL
jgi:L-amino acid N-acyltransferase YncA